MIYFVRHGESEANIKGIFAGQRDDSPITQTGEQQARDTAKKILEENIQIDTIISSPLKRAFETAKIIAEEIGFDTSKIKIDDRIIEYDMGDISGTPIKNISSTILVSAKNTENANNFKKRVKNCIEELSLSSDNILLVSHAGVGRMLKVIRKNGEAKLFYDIPGYPNASIIKLDWIK